MQPCRKSPARRADYNHLMPRVGDRRRRQRPVLASQRKWLVLATRTDSELHHAWVTTFLLLHVCASIVYLPTEHMYRFAKFSLLRQDLRQADTRRSHKWGRGFASQPKPSARTIDSALQDLAPTSLVPECRVKGCRCQAQQTFVDLTSRGGWLVWDTETTGLRHESTQEPRQSMGLRITRWQMRPRLIVTTIIVTTIIFTERKRTYVTINPFTVL